MTHSQKKHNELWFNKIIQYTIEGGDYVWPDENETYTIKDGKFIGKKSSILKLKNITTPSFHSKLIVK